LAEKSSKRVEGMTQDEDHLRLLSIFHYVVGDWRLCFPCFRFSTCCWVCP
jgi:hypothetical protein